MRNLIVLLCLILTGQAVADLKSSIVPQSTQQLSLSKPIQQDSLVYFVHTFPSFVERFDLISETWLEEIDLNDIPTAFHVDEDGMYIGFGRRVAVVGTDGSERHLANTNSEISQIVSDDSRLFLLNNWDLLIVDKFTGSIISEGSLRYSTGLSISKKLHRIFSRTSGLSPSDIQFFEYDPVTGVISGGHDSPYHGDYPGGNQTFVEPGDIRVFDNSGTAYFAEDLAYAGSIGESFDDVMFYQGNIIARRDRVLTAYSGHLRETGVHELANTSVGIAQHEGTIFSFSEGGAIGSIEKVEVSDLNPLEPGEPVDPLGLDYPVTFIQQGEDGTLYLLSSELQSIFRWSPMTQEYLETIPLVARAEYMTFMKEENSLILSYSDKKVTKLNLATLKEEHLFNSPQEPCGLAMAGKYIFLCDPSGAWESHFTYSPDGQLIDQKEWNHYSREYVWNPVNRRMYYFRDGTSPNDIIMEDIDEDGKFGADVDSPYHSSAGIMPPIRIAPSGNYVVLGSGRIYDADSLNQVNTLSNDIMDAVWIDAQMVTLWDKSEYSDIQFWDNRLAVERTGRILGKPLRLFEHDGKLVTVTTVDSIPKLALWDADLSQSDVEASLTTRVNAASEGASIIYDLAVSNHGIGEATSVDVALALPDTVHSPIWTCTGHSGADCDSAPKSGELEGQYSVPVGGELRFSLNALIRDGLITKPPEASAAVGYAGDPRPENNLATVSNDTLLTRTKTGTWYAPSRDGEGFVIEITELGSRLIAVVAWYTYVDGEQAWLFGSADFIQGSSSVEIQVIRTEGAQFGGGFDPSDVISSDGGTVTLDFINEEHVDVQYLTPYGSGVISAQRLDGAMTTSTVSSSDVLTEHHSGAWNDYSKPGEGLLISVTGSGSAKTLVVSWFTYLNGRQKWLIGSAAFSGQVQQLTVPLITTTGAYFGEAFSTEDVVSEPWGTGTFKLTDCMEATFEYDGKYAKGELYLGKTVASIGLNCRAPR